MHLWKDIEPFVDKKIGTINVIVDIPKWSNNKYEYDENRWCFKLDRVIHHSMYYPCDYWFIPQTLSKDWDPCDVFLLVTNPTFPWCLVQARPIWILYTTDNAGEDPKIIAVPVSKIDPRRDEIHHIDDLWQHMKKEMLSFFKEIKLLEHEKYDLVEVHWFGSVLEAQEEVIMAAKRFDDEHKE
jgi:inorganic pyrophosphatase